VSEKACAGAALPPDVQETVGAVIDQVFEYALAHFLPDGEMVRARFNFNGNEEA